MPQLNLEQREINYKAVAVAEMGDDEALQGCHPVFNPNIQDDLIVC
jgi:hypothetical protein